MIFRSVSTPNAEMQVVSVYNKPYDEDDDYDGHAVGVFRY